MNTFKTPFLFFIFPFFFSSLVVAQNIDSIPAIVPLEKQYQYDFIERDSLTRYTKLTEEDYDKIAQELDIEIAAIKAVVSIEAGKSHKGFAEPGVPIINFDKNIFVKFLSKAGISTQKYKGNIAFSRVNIKKYGSYSKAQFARLNAAKEINADIANMATFWGMFQIGGFNWKKCGASSIDEFVFQMSYSEEMQLELFARFLINSDLVKYLKAKNWRAFARAYNGPSYASKGYHKSLASAYNKYK
ncbi:MAG: N-acetylmuramidase family protein [Muribaculaceae bacterium]|nr:N-acetylmuramidase family protein [Muribaculaceae bacterium]